MNISDQILALIRLPEYAQDFEEFNKRRKADRSTSEEGKKNICKKWGLDSRVLLPTPLKTDNIDEALFQSWRIRDRYQSYDNGVEVISHPEMVLSVSLDESEVEAELENIKDINQSWGKQFLELRIDLTARVENVEKEVHEQIILYRQFIRLKEERERGLSFDPWYVYDLHKIKKLSLYKMATNNYIAKKHRNKKDKHEKLQPAYNLKLKAIYSKIQRAYKTAEEMIKRVEDFGRRR